MHIFQMLGYNTQEMWLSMQMDRAVIILIICSGHYI